jgi:hypothetical protein
MTSVEVNNRMEVDSTWIIKGNRSLYPMAGLHAVLKGRFGNKCAGHWMSMTSVIGGVKLLALAYAWSQKVVSYFLSTCGSKHQSSMMYESNFEDEFGNVSSKFLPRPQISHFLYKYLPLIDEHNKQRQSVLGLERKWPIQCCWTRLIVTLTGMCVVDMHRLYQSETRLRNRVLCGQVLEEDATVIRFSELICGKLREQQRPTAIRQQLRCVDAILERIQIDGETNRPLTKAKSKLGKTIGQPIQKICFVCRCYLNANGNTPYCYTSFWCKVCHMPLCNMDRHHQANGCELTYELEHIQSSDNSRLYCLGQVRTKWTGQIDPEDQIDMRPRRSTHSSRCPQCLRMINFVISNLGKAIIYCFTSETAW